MSLNLYKEGTTFAYASSTAATWAWSPSIFVSSGMAYLTGLYGFLWFLIPNVLTLIIFGYISTKVEDGSKWNVAQLVHDLGKKQLYLHKIVASFLLLCSTVVNLIGIYILINHLGLGWSKLEICIGMSVLALAMVWKSGIKGCIISDEYKYWIIIISGIILSAIAYYTGELNLMGHQPKPFIEVTTSFGIITTLSLLSAPYMDQTFWQRAFSIQKEKRIKTFSLAGLLFAVIPCLFGFIGFMQGNISGDWDISKAFTGNLQIVLMMGVLATLISTIDSNLCAFSSLYTTDFKTHKNKNISRIYMMLLLYLSGLVFLNTEVTIVQLFLFYGTVRTCLAAPTLMAIFKRYNEHLIFGMTLLTICIIPPLYYTSTVAFPDYTWLVTLLGLCLPLLAYKKHN